MQLEACAQSLGTGSSAVGRYQLPPLGDVDRVKLVLLPEYLAPFSNFLGGVEQPSRKVALQRLNNRPEFLADVPFAIDSTAVGIDAGRSDAIGLIYSQQYARKIELSLFVLGVLPELISPLVDAKGIASALRQLLCFHAN